MRINCLEPRIYNKIAAGEVVERPASIVKELVENSIDAGATIVTVSIENGGISKISVSDNGCGIHFEDLKTAFLPHATSKIKSEDDLFGIKTLGFRGEALASIASVSEVTLVSKEKTAEHGGKIEIGGGVITTAPTISGSKDGTEITVSNLFFNVPARAKFLKKPKTEEGEITSLIQKFILANPMVSIKYVVDGKIKLLSTGKGISDAVFVVYGKEAIDNSVYMDQDFGYIKIYGYMGKPIISKPNRTYQTIILNNRVIENSTISVAVQSAFGEMLMKKQFPMFAMYIDLDYEMIDVNVHPNKKEVRFEDSQDIYRKVYETVNRSLNNIDHTKTIDTATQDTQETKVASQSFDYTAPTTVEIKTEEPKESVTSKSSYSSGSSYSSSSYSSSPSYSNRRVVDYNHVNDDIGSKKVAEQQKEYENIVSAMGILSDDDNSLNYGISIGSKLLDKLTRQVEESEQYRIEETNTVNVKIVGTMFNTYIVCEKEDNIYLIDQHAGHERILFDKLNNQIITNNIEQQNLLVPFMFSVNPKEESYIEEVIPNLADIGFIIEPFGNRTYKVTSVPYLLSDINLKDFITDILSDIKTIETIELKDLLKDKLASMACKSAVKAGDMLMPAEINKLLSLFVEGQNKLLCPHGRPVVVNLPRKEIEKWFKRIV